MRKTRVAQASLFEDYSKHEFGVRLKSLSKLLDQHPEILTLVATDLVNESASDVGRWGLSVENIFRCMLLKEQLGVSYVGVSYEQLSFHLSDSMTYRTFTRLSPDSTPSRSGLQATIRSIKPETLSAIHETLSREIEGTLIS